MTTPIATTPTHDVEYSFTTTTSTTHQQEDVHDSKIQLNNDSTKSQHTNGEGSSSSRRSIEKTAHREPTAKEGLMAIVKSSWINPLVIFIPFGIASHFVWSPTVTFVLNFIAIVPLAKLLGYATEDISLRIGEVMKSGPTSCHLLNLVHFSCVA